MKKFKQLVIHEMNRAKKFYLSLITGVFGWELIFIIWQTIRYLEQRRNPDLYGNVPEIHFGYFVSYHMMFAMVIGAAITAMLLYAFYTWVREWRFQGSFIYRLLLLPGKRVSIAYAKLASLMLMIFGLLAVQVVFTYVTNIGLQSFVSGQSVSSSVRELNYVVTDSMFNTLFLPKDFRAFVLIYAVGFGVLVWIANLVVGFFSLQAKSFAIMIGSLISYSVLSVLLISACMNIAANIILIQHEIYFYLALFVVVWLVWHLSIMHYLMKRHISI
ncbi:hypothetical protein NHG35_01075 [Aerococcaceae bacterium NML180378]|nr:hypothetical protein [Aerococcaceae bacterium NML180378]